MPQLAPAPGHLYLQNTLPGLCRGSLYVLRTQHKGHVPKSSSLKPSFTGLFHLHITLFLSFFVVLGFELRAYTMSHSTSPGLASNHNPSYLCLLTSWDYRCEPLAPGSTSLLMTIKALCSVNGLCVLLTPLESQVALNPTVASVPRTVPGTCRGFTGTAGWVMDRWWVMDG
jgi:hypothetical protein